MHSQPERARCQLILQALLTHSAPHTNSLQQSCYAQSQLACHKGLSSKSLQRRSAQGVKKFSAPVSQVILRTATLVLQLLLGTRPFQSDTPFTER